jgi:integrase
MSAGVNQATSLALAAGLQFAAEKSGGEADRELLAHLAVVVGHDVSLAAASNPEVIRFLAYTGLRWGEVAALKVENFDMLGRRVNVVQGVAEVQGHLVYLDGEEPGAPSRYERARVGSRVDVFESRIRLLLAEFPDMPATVIAERIGWEHSSSVLRARVAQLRPLFRPTCPTDRTTYVSGEIVQCDLWFPGKVVP